MTPHLKMNLIMSRYYLKCYTFIKKYISHFIDLSVIGCTIIVVVNRAQAPGYKYSQGSQYCYSVGQQSTHNRLEIYPEADVLL